jgi:hypothetical protein
MIYMRMILLLVLPVLVLFGLALVLMWVPLARPFPPALSSARNLMAAMAVGLLGMVYLAGVAVIIVGQVLRAGRSLDEVLAAQGLAPAKGLLLGRVYEGAVQGYPMRASWVPGYGVRPGQLLVKIDADVGLIAAVGDRRPLRPSADAVRVDSSVLQGWAPVVWVEAGQAEHVAALLADQTVASALFQLLAASEPGGVRDLRLARDHMEFRARPSTDAAVQHAGEWIQTLLVLAAQLEHTEESRVSDG